MFILLSIGLFQKSSPEYVLVGGGDKDQLASLTDRQSVIYHHGNPLSKWKNWKERVLTGE